MEYETNKYKICEQDMAISRGDTLLVVVFLFTFELEDLSRA